MALWDRFVRERSTRHGPTDDDIARFIDPYDDADALSADGKVLLNLGEPSGDDLVR